jgi:tRNA A37 threonylcarbamoyladenosine modification protein TsaB
VLFRSFLAVGIGPGSFTGTRIGIVSTKAMAYTLNLPIVEFCSLGSFIPLNTPESFSILSDAKSGQVYQLDVIRERDDLIKLSNPLVKKFSDLNLSDFSFFSPDPSLLKAHSNIQATNFNLELLGSIIIQEFSKKKLTNAFNLKPIYLKNP